MHPKVRSYYLSDTNADIEKHVIAFETNLEKRFLKSKTRQLKIIEFCKKKKNKIRVIVYEKILYKIKNFLLFSEIKFFEKSEIY